MNPTTRRTHLFVLAVSAAALAATFGVVSTTAMWDRRDATAAAFFFVFGLIAQLLGYTRGQGRVGTIAFLPYLAISALSPNGAALGSVVLSLCVGEVLNRRDFLKATFNVSQHLLATALAILVYLAVGGTALIDGSPSLTAFAGLLVTYMLVNRAVVAGVLSIVNRTAFRRELYVVSRGTLVNDVLALPLVLIFALMYAKLGYVWSGLLALPMIGVRQLYKSVFELERINEELLQLMVAAIEARDPYTSGHSQRVARYSRVIARAIGQGSRQVEEIGTAALLHDVGKIHEEFAPILRLPRKLTVPEFEIMKTHSAKGAVLVSKVSQFKNIVTAVRGHHEAWSGKGYPDALAGDDIPLGARIITIADTIDAMTTVRPYRPPRSLNEVRAELERVTGVQFDPRICKVLLTEASWQEICLEVEIAAREFPADTAPALVESGDVPRHSTQFRIP